MTSSEPCFDETAENSSESQQHAGGDSEHCLGTVILLGTVRQYTKFIVLNYCLF